MRSEHPVKANPARRTGAIHFRTWATLLLAAASSLVFTAASAGAAGGFDTGIDDIVLTAPSEEARDTWFDRTEKANASLVRLNVIWTTIATSEPAAPRDPADPAYDFSRLDGAITDAVERGLKPLLTNYLAPAWAEGANRPSVEKAPQGTWKPSPTKFADFGAAIARRYSGNFPDPTGGTLPRVRYFEAWNEPNLNNFLTPQRQGKKPKSPEHYRKLLNAFYDAVTGIKSTNKIVGPATAPFGDPKGSKRIEPLEFHRELFCIRGKNDPRPKANCKTSKLPKLDIVSHHPIGAWGGGPQNSALTSDDVTSADMDRLDKVARAAAKAGNILPRSGGKKSKPRDLWATEFFYFSDPPLSGSPGVGLAKHARWLEESLFIFWKDGADAAIWLGLADSPDNGLSNPSPFSAGLFFEGGKVKPSRTAFRFPFVTERKSASKIKVWGKAPESGKLEVQKKSSGGWKTIKRISVKKGQIFYKKAALSGGAKLRGALDGETSRTWTQKN